MPALLPFLLGAQAFGAALLKWLLDHPRVLAGVVIVLAGLVWGELRYHQGEAAASARYERQIAAQQAANDAAAAAAARTLMQVADRLSLKSLELEKALADVNTATDQSGTGGSVALPRGVVRSLDAIR